MCVTSSCDSVIVLDEVMGLLNLTLSISLAAVVFEKAPEYTMVMFEANCLTIALACMALVVGSTCTAYAASARLFERSSRHELPGYCVLLKKCSRVMSSRLAPVHAVQIATTRKI